MSTDRELDALVAGAALVHDAELPALPDDFLAELRSAADQPASVLAARQLVADAQSRRDRPGLRRRRPTRRVLLRVGAAGVAVAAALTVAVLVTPRDEPATPQAGPPTTGAPVIGISLVAAERATFPLSLDPVPDGLTPTFSRRGGVASYPGQPLVFSADYSSADGDRVVVRLFPDDPRALPDSGWSLDEPVTGGVTVDGAAAEVRGGDGIVTLLWERPDGRWLQVLGEGAYGDVAATVGVAESVVDRAQPVGLQFGLAPAGWSIGGYEESQSLDLVSDTEPQLLLRLSLLGPADDGALDAVFEGDLPAAPVETVTIQGAEGRLGLLDGGDSPDSWRAVGRLPGGPLFLLVGPEELTREQMLTIAEQVTYTP